MQVITTEKMPIKLWADDIEKDTLQQAKNLANLPFLFKHVALMPDSHLGYGIPIGGVIALKNVVIPNAVGVDIGCGVCAVKTSINHKDITTEQLKVIMSKIRQRIPLGTNRHKTKMEWSEFHNAPDIEIIQLELESAKYQLGTLGGGNHFIEIQCDQNDFVWIMVHSGSRNFGLKIANEYHRIAKGWCNKWYSNIPDFDLSFFPLETHDAHEYMAAMYFALKFAKENRFKMITTIKEILTEEINDVIFDDLIDVHHNYASIENHFNENVVVHRKGAISARQNQIGLIPGSQGTKSYVVKGKGNVNSFMSCSHGSGRKMGRKQAQKNLNLQDEIKKLDNLNIVHSIRNVDDLDEAPGAYKDIKVVMKNQSDLVNIVAELKPLAVIKG